MKWYKSSWVRTTHINPWGINLGFATILLCIYNELLLPHSTSSNTFKRKERIRGLCVYLMSLWEGRGGVMDQKAIASPPPPPSSGIPLKRADPSPHGTCGVLLRLPLPGFTDHVKPIYLSAITRNDFSFINHCYPTGGGNAMVFLQQNISVLWFHEGLVFFSPLVFFFPKSTICTINFRLLPKGDGGTSLKYSNIATSLRF